jgi:hypothetical protein
MSTIVASASGGTRNWSDTATWVGGVVPTAADDVQLDGTSGAVTVTAGAVCRSLDCAGYTGTLTHTTAVTLTIGDATTGAGNVALRLAAGMTYTLGSALTSAITLVSTSATVQSIDSGGKTLGNFTVNAPGGSYQLTSGLTTGATSTSVTLTAGTFNTNGQTCSWGSFTSSNTNTRSLILGASSITLGVNGWSCATATNMTLSAGTSTLTFNAAAGGAANLGINLSYNNLVFTNGGVGSITSSGGVGTGTIANLTRTGTAAKTDELTIATPLTITGVFTINGNSVTNRVLLQSNVVGSNRTLTVNGSVVASNVDVSDITGLGSASWNLAAITGGSGDGGGNVGITFTASVAQTWAGTAGGSWSANAWTTRVPLPQDDVTISAAFAASQTVTMDMPRLGRNIDWTGATGAPTWAISAVAVAVFGSLTMAAGMVFTSAGPAIHFRGRGARTITSNGVAFPSTVNFTTGITGTGSYTLLDAFTVTTGVLNIGLTPHRAIVDTNGQTVTCPTIVVGSVTGGSSLTLGASTVNLTGTATGAIFSVVVVASPANVVSAGTSTIVVVNASANDRSIVAHGQTLATVTYTVAGSTGRLIFGASGATGTVTVAVLNFSDATNARGLRIWTGTTLAITSAFNVAGASGRLVTIDSSTPGSRATLSKISGLVSTDYLSVLDSAAAGGASWYAGANSTNAGNNTGWTFTAPPAVINAGSFFAFI